jgi:hypothetical protein
MSASAFQCRLAVRGPGGGAARVPQLAQDMQRRVGLYAFGMTPLSVAQDRTAEHVARRLAARRNELRLSLAEVAARCGVSLQQIHRYEVGLNTVSAPMLWQLSRCLAVDIGYFFEGLETEG